MSDIIRVSKKLGQSLDEAIAHWLYFDGMRDYLCSIEGGQLSRCSSFFRHSLMAHFRAAVMGLFTVLDRGGDLKYLSLERYALLVRDEYPGIAAGIDQLIARHVQGIASLRILRHRYVAHLPIKGESEAAFTDTGFQVDDISALVDDLLSLYLEIGRAAGDTWTSPHPDYFYEVSQLFEAADRYWTGEGEQILDVGPKVD